MLVWGMPIKDVATIMVGLAALVTSVSVAIFNWKVQRAKRADDARKIFDDALTGIQTARADLEKLRADLGEKFGSPESLSRRVLISDRRNFYLARALTAVKTGGFPTTSVDNLLIAATLIDTGRAAASVPYYRRAVDRADDAFERAVAMRVHGRARLLAGEMQAGRLEMRDAIKTFKELALDQRFDRARMHREAADTARRLVDASDIIRFEDFIRPDLEEMEELAAMSDELGRAASEQVSARVRARLDPPIAAAHSD